MTFGGFISDKRGIVLIGLMVVGLLSSGLYYYSTRYVSLGGVSTVMPDLAPSVPANMFVQPDYQRLPIQTADYATAGHYTVVVFHQQRCPDCQRLDRELVDFLKYRKDVAVRKIDLGANWSTQGTLRDFGRKIRWTPFVVIYGPDLKLVQADDAGKRKAWKLLSKWIEHESAKAAHSQMRP
jgi:hypothetical protein